MSAKRQLTLTGLCLSRETKSDRRMPHMLTRPQLYSHLRHRCDKEQVYGIIREAVALEKEFLTEALPCNLIGINASVGPTSAVNYD